MVVDVWRSEGTVNVRRTWIKDFDSLVVVMDVWRSEGTVNVRRMWIKMVIWVLPLGKI